MEITKTISSSDLIDLLETFYGNIYENIKEDSEITEIKMLGNLIEITIE